MAGNLNHMFMLEWRAWDSIFLHARAWVMNFLLLAMHTFPCLVTLDEVRGGSFFILFFFFNSHSCSTWMCSVSNANLWPFFVPVYGLKSLAFELILALDERERKGCCQMPRKAVPKTQIGRGNDCPGTRLSPRLGWFIRRISSSGESTQTNSPKQAQSSDK
jgi:hypothetical protein